MAAAGNIARSLARTDSLLRPGAVWLTVRELRTIRKASRRLERLEGSSPSSPRLRSLVQLYNADWCGAALYSGAPALRVFRNERYSSGFRVRPGNVARTF